MSIKGETSFSLKDHLFNAETVGVLAAGLAGALPGFDRTGFTREVLDAFPGLELKERIRWMVTVLGGHLPPAFPRALTILGRALPAPLDPGRCDDDFGEFIWVVPGEYVARHGCTRRRLGPSLRFLREATMRFSSESAIRPFLREFPEETLAFVHECAIDENYHVRRLASEGIRPLLPWAERVDLPAPAVVAVLDRLHADPTRYVTRSVANALNDVSKTHPDLVLDTLARWRKAGRQERGELEWMTRHALRTLARRDDPRALELLGFPTRAKVRISELSVPSRVRVGGELACAFVLESRAPQHLLVSLRLHFRKATGALAPKVFAVRKAFFDRGDVARLRKTVSFRPMTTRTLYPGRHRVDVVVNGRTVAAGAFDLVT